MEAALDGHPDVATSAVVDLPDADLGHRVHAIVQRRAGAVLDAEALISWVATRPARYKVPRVVEFVDEQLRDDAGKTRRSALRDARR
ncbi:AMP-binding enzyme [Sphingomonas sp.]|uniref:AMP-binding enzyme n=1 Tax=Sphingomonas sp. TaxID=28214 RepID=UPI002D7FD97E|nr:hypothetical protein [Sphingomonas sp.]HEU0043460.1 hypothetical protein [Sphingomonas sp.]